MTTLHIISAGAAKGLIQAMQPGWCARTGATLDGSFGAVGAMKDELLGGAACDVLVLTQAMLEDLAREGQVRADSIRPLGRVYTGVAVPQGAATPDVGTPDALRSALGAATAIYFPDPQRATAGIHFAKVLSTLRIADAVASRLRPYPNGATAMRAMADAGDLRAIGCTQATEILYTPGVRLVARLPPAFELSTVYSAAICTRAQQAELARDLIEAIAGAAGATLREQGGFERLA